jgi:hypothetical protein
MIERYGGGALPRRFLLIPGAGSEKARCRSFERSCSIKKLERGRDSVQSEPALALAGLFSKSMKSTGFAAKPFF